MFELGSGYIVKAVFENLTATYLIFDNENRSFYRYHGQDYRRLEFINGDHVTFRKLKGVEYVVGVKKTVLKSENIPSEPAEIQDSEINTNDN